MGFVVGDGSSQPLAVFHQVRATSKRPEMPPLTYLVASFVTSLAFDEGGHFFPCNWKGWTLLRIPDFVFPCDGRVCLPTVASLLAKLFSKFCSDAGDTAGGDHVFPWIDIICTALRWTCVSPRNRLPCERTCLEVLFRCRRCKWWRSRLSLAWSCTSSSWHCLSLRWTCVPPWPRQPPCKAFFEVLFWRRRYKRWRSRLSLDKDRHHLHSFALDVCASSRSPALWESFSKVLFRRRRFIKKAAFASFLGLKLRIFFPTLSFLAMDMSASAITPALWESAGLHGSSLSTKAFMSYLRWTLLLWRLAPSCNGHVCVPPALRQPRAKDS